MGSFVVIVTGASGSVYGMRTVEQLILAGHGVDLIVTPAGQQVIELELGFLLPKLEATHAVARFLELPSSDRLRLVPHDDLRDALASGSSVADAVVVAPASMGFIASAAAGLASDLPERVVDVALKERRPVVLVPRETPLSLIHLRNLTTLAEAGAIVLPAMPAFYTYPSSLDDAVNFVVGRVLDVLGVAHDLYPRWRGRDA